MAKKTRTALSARDKMLKRKEDLKSRGEGRGGINFIKEGVTRLRLKSPGDDEEIGIEIIQFYLGTDMGGVISPATFDEPCPFMEQYHKLKSSGDEEDKEYAKKLVPRRRYVVGGISYKDEKGKEIDTEKIDQAWLITGSIYQDIIDLYLDEDEWGDMTDPEEGYDIKIIRSGSGKMDTTYSCSPCQKKPLNKKYHGTIDLKSIVKSQIKSYDELETMLHQYMDIDDVEENDEPKKKSKTKMTSRKDVSKSKKKSTKKRIPSKSDDLPF